MLALIAQAFAAPVVVAVETLPPGTVLTKERIRVVDVPADFLPPQAVRDPAKALGRVVRDTLLKHAFVREERLAEPGAKSGVEALLWKGTVATPVPVRALPPVQVGDPVDVYRVQGEPCLLVDGAYVGGFQQAGETVFSASGAVDGIRLVTVPSDALRLKTTTASTLRFALRSRLDLAQTEGVPVCEL